MTDIAKALVDSLIASREAPVNTKKDGSLFASRINQNDKREADKILKEYNRRLELPSEESESISVQTYNRYMSYLRKIIKEKNLRNPVAINGLNKIKYKNQVIERAVNRIINADHEKSQNSINELFKHIDSQIESPRRTKDEIKEWKAFRKECLKHTSKLDPKFLLDFIRTKEIKKRLEDDQANTVKKYQNIENDKVFDFLEAQKLAINFMCFSPNSEAFTYKQKEASVPFAGGKDSGVKKSRRAQNGIYALILGVALATGRRQYEIAYLSDFEAIDEETIEVKNLAKKRGEVNESYTIKTVLNAYEIMKAIRKIRSSSLYKSISSKIKASDFEALENYHFSNSVSNKLNAAARNLMKDLIKDPSGNPIKARFKDSRDIYAISLYEKYVAGGGNLKLTAFIEQNLSHKSMETALSYQKFRTQDGASAGDIMRAARLEVKASRRTEGLKVRLAMSDIQKSKPLVRLAEYVLARVKEDSQFVINTAVLRKARLTGCETKNLASPRMITQFVKLVRESDLDLPA